MVTNRTNAHRCPALIMRGFYLHSVEDRGNHAIGLYRCKATDQLDGLRRADVSVLPYASSRELNFGMVTPLPVQDQFYGIADRLSDDFFDHGAHDALLV